MPAAELPQGTARRFVSSMICRLSSIISPEFVEPHRAFRDGYVNQLVLCGGRGSGKSTFASAQGILLLLKYPRLHGVVMRKVAATLRTTVYPQYVWAIEALGLGARFKCSVSPMTITYLPTGQKLMFLGADDAGKIKSLKVAFGYVGFLHFEELDQFSEGEVADIERSVLRGQSVKGKGQPGVNTTFEIKSFNPPKSKTAWVNKYCLRDRPRQLIHHSSYLSMPPEWLGERFLADAEFLKKSNPLEYRNVYLGEAVGAGGNVFENVVIRPIDDNEIAGFDRLYYGLDWGWYPDPNHFSEMYYSASKRELYIFGEIRRVKINNRDFAALLGRYKDVRITADSSEKKSIDDFRSYGFNMRGAVKGPGSVDYSMKWLSSLRKIVIDMERCPFAADEFLFYEYERDRDGNEVGGYPDRDNHAIDSVRYALEGVWSRRGG